MKTARELAEEINSLVEVDNADTPWDFDINKAESLILADRREVIEAVRVAVLKKQNFIIDKELLESLNIEIGVGKK